MFRDERELGVVHFFGFCGKNIVFTATGFQFPIRCEPAIKLIKWLPNIIKLHTLCCVTDRKGRVLNIALSPDSAAGSVTPLLLTRRIRRRGELAVKGYAHTFLATKGQDK